MIKPYLRDLINEHKPTVELNNTNNSNNNANNSNNNTNNSNNKTNTSNNKENDRTEWKIQLVMQNNCISDKDFIRTIYLASKPVQIFMGRDTANAIDTLFNTILNRIQQAIETSNKRRSRFTHESVALLYYYFQKIDIKRGESYIISSDWIVSKKAILNPKNSLSVQYFQD